MTEINDIVDSFASGVAARNDYQAKEKAKQEEQMEEKRRKATEILALAPVSYLALTKDIQQTAEGIKQNEKVPDSDKVRVEVSSFTVNIYYQDYWYQMQYREAGLLSTEPQAPIVDIFEKGKPSERAGWFDFDLKDSKLIWRHKPVSKTSEQDFTDVKDVAKLIFEWVRERKVRR